MSGDPAGVDIGFGSFGVDSRSKVALGSNEFSLATAGQVVDERTHTSDNAGDGRKGAVGKIPDLGSEAGKLSLSDV